MLYVDFCFLKVFLDFLRTPFNANSSAAPPIPLCLIAEINSQTRSNHSARSIHIRLDLILLNSSLLLNVSFIFL